MRALRGSLAEFITTAREAWQEFSIPFAAAPPSRGVTATDGFGPLHPRTPKIQTEQLCERCAEERRQRCA